MKWAKETQNSISTSSMIVLGYWKLSRGKAYSRPKIGLASIGQIIAWQEHQDGMAKVLTDPQKMVRNVLENERPTIKQDPA